jgi:hypothetical protein
LWQFGLCEIAYRGSAKRVMTFRSRVKARRWVAPSAACWFMTGAGREDMSIRPWAPRYLVVLFASLAIVSSLRIVPALAGCGASECNKVSIIYDGPAGQPHCHEYDVANASVLRSNAALGGLPANNELNNRRSLSSCAPECAWGNINNLLSDVWKAADNGGTQGAWVEYGYPRDCQNS